MTSQEGAPAFDAELIGRTVDGYRIESLLGAGGMGRVYKAWDTRLSRPVALKTVSGERPPADLLARFEREGRALAALNHPNIAQVYFVGKIGGRPYLAMEYVEGSTLSELLERGIRLPTLRRLDLLIQATEGLSAAWLKGIVHRDVKPSNLLIGEDGRLRILDFGLARQPAGDVSLTATGLAVGTPHYMSPEQALGRSVDFRSDLYSLGATFYHLLTGHPPFESDSPVALLVAHVQKPAMPAHERAADVPLALSSILDRLLAKQPEQRYPTYEQLLDDLHSARRALGRPVDSAVGARLRTTVTPAAHPAASPRVRIPVIPLVGGAVAVVVVAIALGNRDSAPTSGAEPEAVLTSRTIPPSSSPPLAPRAATEASPFPDLDEPDVETPPRAPETTPTVRELGGQGSDRTGSPAADGPAGFTMPSAFLDLAARSRTLAQMRRVGTAVEILRATEDRTPTDLRALVAGGYVHERELVDAWGAELRLTLTPSGYSLRSAGADGVDPSDDDIVLEDGTFVQGGFEDFAPPPRR